MEKEKKANGNIKNKLPFAIFVCLKEDEEIHNYYNVVTEIISDRIQKVFKEKQQL